MAALQTIELDGYDLDVFDRIFRTEPGLRATGERLGRILPHPEALLADLFGVLFKLNVMVRPAQEVSPAVLVNRRLVDAVLGHPGSKSLRAETQLDEGKTRDALVLVADRVLRAMTRKGRARPDALVEGMEVADDEAALDEKKQTLEHLEELEGDPLDPESKAEVQRDLKKEIGELEKKLKKARETQARHADNLPLDMDNEVGSSVERMTEEMAELDQNIRGLGLGAGGDGKQDARRRLELGERLAQSKKLRLLARLAGAFKEVAFEARKKTIPRAPQTMHAVTQGSDLAHLLPSELPGLDKSRRGVHLDFLRRFVEGRLLQYDLRAPANRGPMVVCVDGSGSMSGSKEIWAKAVALTLMEIARREKRRCLAMVFSDGPEVFEVELLAKGRGAGSRLKVSDESVLAFAEHFPGGGTNFEAPLRRAVDAVTTGTYRNGDVIFITDGEASIGSELVEEIAEGRKKHRFKIRGLLVDMQQHRPDELAKVADELRNVSDLTGDALSDLFSAV
jgi:uncharacterized protein with von Willebrand factor type A (vWA) domain